MNFDNIKVLLFSNGNFSESKDRLIEHLNNIGVNNIISLNDNDLPIKFKKEYSEILNNKRGYGYCLWKPFIILNELISMGEDDILFYIDSTDIPELKLFEFIINHFNENTYLFFNRGYNNGEWTKRDTFFFMNCDNELYYNATQLEAGNICLKKTSKNIEILNEWFYFCKNKNILTELPNICGLPNLDNFKEHRYDQSILTNIIIKNDINSFNFTCEYIKYNYNQPLIY